MMSVTVRDAGPGDEAAIVDLVQELAVASDWPSPVDEHYARRFLAKPDAGVLLAEDDGAVVGLLSYVVMPGLFHAADSGFIEALVVTEGRRGEGIGRRLLEHTVGVLKDAGCVELSIGAGADDERARHLYASTGFTEASVLLEMHVDPPTQPSG